MDFLEKDLEEIIFTSDREKLEKAGLFINGKLYRQLKIGNYGIADLVSVNRSYDEYIYTNRKEHYPFLDITIYELKKDKIGISAFLQAIGYMRGIKSYLEKRKFGFEFRISIVLIGKEIDKNSTYCYLEDLIPAQYDGSGFLWNYKYLIDIDGLRFENATGYKLIDEGF